MKKFLFLLLFSIIYIGCSSSDDSSESGRIISLNCTETTNTGTLTEGTASFASITVPYTGGNGGNYNAQSVNSTGVTGLTAEINSGNFESGSGVLTYIITGTPSSSGMANFDLSIGGQSCIINFTVRPAEVAFNLMFSQNFDGDSLTAEDLSITVFTNQFGTKLNISRLRYLVSRLVLTNSNGENFSLSPYHLVDLSISETQTLNTNVTVPEGDYTLSFVYGFNEEDNIDGAYLDLNSVSWNWPEMLGGGYHFLQMDGQYNVNTEPAPYNYHNGTARVSEGVFEQNFVVFNLPNTLTISENSTINIQMNVAEWFRNPNTWDLNVYNTPLMPNFEAQKMMQQNAATVFSAFVQ